MANCQFTIAGHKSQYGLAKPEGLKEKTQLQEKNKIGIERMICQVYTEINEKEIKGSKYRIQRSPDDDDDDKAEIPLSYLHSQFLDAGTRFLFLYLTLNQLV